MGSPDLKGLSLLVVDDELLLRRQITAELERLGTDITQAGTLKAARDHAATQGFDAVLLDVNLPDGKGTDLLQEGVFGGNAAVVVMTADGGLEGAVEAMRLGALDYLVKPFEPGELTLVIQRALRTRQHARLEEHRRRESTGGGDFFFGRALEQVESQLRKILATDARLQTALPPVLIEGETGTGKTTIARWLHNQGPRANQPLVEINCSALPEALAESELFGHERGAFTDARAARMGLFEAANGGTLFLDELPSLSLSLQAKLLTAIEDGKIRRVGSNRMLPVDVRILAATSRDLKQLIAAGQFREDLYHRLDLCRIFLTPLRERGEEQIALANRFLKRLCQRHRLPTREISDTGRRRLLSYRWPGNVRELAHELERAVIFDEDAKLDFSRLPVPDPSPSPLSDSRADWFCETYVFPEEGFSLEQAIDRLVGSALKQTRNNVSAAARLLGVTRDYLRYRMTGQKKEETPSPDGDNAPN